MSLQQAFRSATSLFAPDEQIEHAPQLDAQGLYGNAFLAEQVAGGSGGQEEEGWLSSFLGGFFAEDQEEEEAGGEVAERVPRATTDPLAAQRAQQDEEVRQWMADEEYKRMKADDLKAKADYDKKLAAWKEKSRWGDAGDPPTAPKMKVSMP